VLERAFTGTRCTGAASLVEMSASKVMTAGLWWSRAMHMSRAQMRR
jgi:hypothetical protein